jgi:hypothetical protein
MPADRRIYRGISPAHFEELLAELRQRGFSTVGDSIADPTGVVEFKGVRAEYRYDRQRRTLEVGILHKPKLLPSWLIWSSIEQAAKKCWKERERRDGLARTRRRV